MNKEPAGPNVVHLNFTKKNLAKRAGSALVRAAKERPGQLAAVSLATVFAASQALAQHGADKPHIEDKAPVCVPGPDTQEYVFKQGQGANHAVYAIEGSGAGEADPCWSDAQQIVKDAIHETGYDLPQAYDSITIPVEIHRAGPTQKQP